MPFNIWVSCGMLPLKEMCCQNLERLPCCSTLTIDRKVESLVAPVVLSAGFCMLATEKRAWTAGWRLHVLLECGARVSWPKPADCCVVLCSACSMRSHLSWHAHYTCVSGKSTNENFAELLDSLWLFLWSTLQCKHILQFYFLFQSGITRTDSCIQDQLTIPLHYYRPTQ